MAVDQRHPRDPDRRHLELEALLARERAQLLDEPLALLRHVGDRFALPSLVVLALEHTGDLTLRGPEQLLHVARQPASLARGERDRLRAVGLGEVVHVHPVVRARLRLGEAPEVVAYGAQPAGPGRAGDEEVVAERLDLEAELDRGERARLADRADERLDLPRRVERERVRVDAPSEPLWVELEVPVVRATRRLAHLAMIPAPVAGRQTCRAAVAARYRSRVSAGQSVFGS